METVGTNSLFTILRNAEGLVEASNRKVREQDAPLVGNYFELAKLVSALQFRNQDLVLFFRGQREDYRDSGLTTIRPTIFRDSDGDYKSKWSNSRKQNIFVGRLEGKFKEIRRAERFLLDHYSGKGRFSGRGIVSQRIRRQRIVRWSILQHYEICETPLLDVTQSLRIAASFASLQDQEFGYVMVVGVPNISGAITASAEAGIQIVRLSSVCPPEASRPHLQEGFLLSEYPELGDPQQAGLYQKHETDLGVRLVAKFKFRCEEFWRDSRDFPRISKDALFPSNENDEFLATADSIRSLLTKPVNAQ